MMIRTDRRTFVAGTSFASMAALAGCTGAGETAPEEAAAAPSYTELLGVQLYTVRDLFERDARGTLEALAEIGVKDCETAGLFEHKAADIRAIMSDLGLVSRSAHIRLPELQDGIGPSLEDADILGQSNLYLGWIPEEERTPDRYRALADLLNERGGEAKAAGKMIGYHNHEFEFIEQDGTTGYDILLERTDPELVTMELDFFWVAEAGKDPLAIFESAPGRFTSCHIKDRNEAGEMVSVGDGVIDFKTLLPIAEKAGIERFYVEHDNPEDPLISVGRGFTHLTG
ncbi:sugar phosphate isomerase/epimerase [uncultured Erythrobacter sp.]|uniref:sugar phosphate isomerase/epimerase family protein n=1 Tax=uncultured Erythrobacter sp. TaxID=263913 RepID=UPI00261BCBA3|nr:sugar phosphate isomerase/epimerase [uncultured Erythrobacter sp.]